MCEQLYEVVLAKQRLRIQQPVLDHRIGTGLALSEHLTPPETAQADADEVGECAMPFPDDSCENEIESVSEVQLNQILNEQCWHCDKAILATECEVNGSNWINCGDKC